MTREEAKRLLPIIKAFSEGKTIEVMNTSGHWDEINIPNFDVDPKKYRIKPKPKYRPFKDAEECWNGMLKHQPFGWVKFQCDLFLIIHIEDNSIGYGSACGTILHSKFNDTLKGFTFADGTPFGVKIEEE